MKLLALRQISMAEQLWLETQLIGGVVVEESQTTPSYINDGIYVNAVCKYRIILALLFTLTDCKLCSNPALKENLQILQY